MADHRVARVDDVDDGDRIITYLEGREVAVFNVDGEYYAYANWCAHQGGPLCSGPLDGTVAMTFDRDELRSDFRWEREGEVLACPWHGWEFDVTTGECLSRRGLGVPSYEVVVDDGELVVSIT